MMKVTRALLATLFWRARISGETTSFSFIGSVCTYHMQVCGYTLTLERSYACGHAERKFKTVAEMVEDMNHPIRYDYRIKEETVP